VCSRRKRASSRSSSRLNAASRSQQHAKLSVSNFYDLYDSIETGPYSPSVFLPPSTPTSIIKHSELITALPPAEYLPMNVRIIIIILIIINAVVPHLHQCRGAGTVGSEGSNDPQKFTYRGQT